VKDWRRELWLLREDPLEKSDVVFDAGEGVAQKVRAIEDDEDQAGKDEKRKIQYGEYCHVRSPQPKGHSLRNSALP